jgi:hypothetical protein
MRKVQGLRGSPGQRKPRGEWALAGVMVYLPFQRLQGLDNQGVSQHGFLPDCRGT